MLKYRRGLTHGLLAPVFPDIDKVQFTFSAAQRTKYNYSRQRLRKPTTN